MKIIFTIAIAILLSLKCAAQQEQFRTDSVLFELFYTSKAKGVKLNNIDIDTINSVITIPVHPDLDLDKFDLKITPTAKVSFSRGKGNFNTGPVLYRMSIQGKGEKEWKVFIKKWGNPVLPGLFADPDIIYSQKTKRYHIYPTSDGFTNWSGTYFKSFSSSDLANWRDDGEVLNLKDVSWAKGNAWAPAIIERIISGKYRYFYYYCADKKIGVAVGDHPMGPFKDTDKALLDTRPEGFLKKGQTIDPDVFEDPKTGKFYLFWGNGFMAGAELNDDMISIKKETIKELTPKSYTEGTHVFYRDGRYYFLWSENDTRDPNYRVRYGTSNSPLSGIISPKDNIILSRIDEHGIYATGHNSTIKVKGKNEWYMIYHRFSFPHGIHMGREAGYNREVCIDRMGFEDDGAIKIITPTHQGIKPISSKSNK
ncbi:family 43 glycosylhydrolase [Pedobacter sp. MC2016-05]|uniref:family 43 glycosylhydrolase n=1 Tax=Pedobacter sp. MC2016-05 TaxID=2994474 RepID=UPI002248416C|nr:family 43 glycosylhydrolase [Pedobacter sp. MC2016-05]MCX2473476.1 family 43 glycosylhydrolase [Pedobacter sp. MC2016-05]